MATDLNGRDDVQVGFGASTEGLAAGLSRATAMLEGGVGKMSSTLGGVATAATKVTAAVGTMFAALGGGALIGKAIQQTVQFATEVGQLSRRMQISAGEASAWAVATDDAFMSVQELNQAASQLNRQLRSQEDALKAMGVQTRKSNGEYVDQKTLFLSTLNVIRQYKAGTDQLLAAQTAFGRGMNEEVLQKLLQMQENLDGASEASEEMAQVVGVKNVEAARQFKIAQDNAGDSIQGMQITIGNALIPVFTNLLTLFSRAGASVIPVVGFAFRVLGVTVQGLSELLYGLWQVFTAVVQTVTVGAAGMIDALYSLLKGDVQGAKAKWEAMSTGIADSWKNSSERIEEYSKKSRDAMSAIWEGVSGKDESYTNEGPNRSGGKSFKVYDPNAAKDQLEQMKKQLELMRMAEGDYRELSKQAEVEYWAARRDIFKRGTKEWMEVNALYFQARRAAAREAVEVQRFELDQAIADAGNNLEQRVRLAEQWLARMTELYGAESKEYRDALRQKLDAERNYRAQQQQFADMRAASELAERNALVSIAVEQAAFLVELGRMTRGEFAQVERASIEERYRLALEDIERRRTLYAGDLQVQEQLNAEKRALDMQLQEALRRNTIEQQRVVRDSWSEMLDGMFMALGSVTNQLLQRTITWRQAILKIGDALLASFVDIGVRRLRDWVLTELMMTKASTVGNAARAASAMAASATAATAKAAEASTVISANAAEAATGAAASQAAIPVVGPALAVAAAAALFGLVMGYAMRGKGGGGGTSLPSARGGWWDIPRDTLAMVHAEEMIMPPELAEGVRNAVEGNAPVGRGGGVVQISAIDGPSVERFFRQHGDKVMDALMTQSRNNPRTRR